MSYPAVQCFWIEFADLAEWGLRRYTSFNSEILPCPRDGGKYGTHHESMIILGQHPAVVLPDNDGENTFAIDSRESSIAWPDKNDPRWPKNCVCGFVFRPEDTFQQWTSMLYKRDTGELMTIRDAPPGAMYDALFWPKSWWHGPDGKHIIVICPNGRPWHMDDRASNCGLPEDNVHRCWVRHGDPPMLTVDKNGATCTAGGGSILSGEGENQYHGFLQNGILTAG